MPNINASLTIRKGTSLRTTEQKMTAKCKVLFLGVIKS